MTWAGLLLVTAVVWTISIIRSVRLRSFVYSLPLPMTLVILTTHPTVTGAQLIGVVGLYLFFVTVTLLHVRFGWHILLADAGGIAAYVALSVLVQAAEPVPFLPALAGVLALWVVGMLALRRRPIPDRVVAAKSAIPVLLKPVVIFAGALVTALLGQALRGMVVTFPYSGVLTAVETRHNLAAFTRYFARDSLALVGFMVGYYWARDEPEPLALAAAWATFAVIASSLHAVRWLRHRGQHRTDHPGAASETADPSRKPAADGVGETQDPSDSDPKPRPRSRYRPRAPGRTPS